MKHSEKFEDIKEVTKPSKSTTDRQFDDTKKKDTTIFYKILHIKIE